MSVDRDTHHEVHVDVDLDDGAIELCRTTEEFETIDDLFRNGQLRLWADSHGWSGIERRTDGYYRVNVGYDATREYLTEERVSREAVVRLIRQHIEDPDAGGYGRFRRGATPP